jgi:hypothetical protein
MKARRFSAPVYKTGINFAVDVPVEVSEGFKKRGHVPVAGTLNGIPTRSTLVPIGGGRHRLFVNGEIRKKASVGEGDSVEIYLALDEEPRKLPMPPEFREALERNEKAGEAWEKMAPSHRKEILAYLNSLKSPDTLKRNVERAINEHLLKNKR